METPLVCEHGHVDRVQHPQLACILLRRTARRRLPQRCRAWTRCCSTRAASRGRRRTPGLRRCPCPISQPLPGVPSAMPFKAGRGFPVVSGRSRALLALQRPRRVAASGCRHVCMCRSVATPAQGSGLADMKVHRSKLEKEQEAWKRAVRTAFFMLSSCPCLQRRWCEHQRRCRVNGAPAHAQAAARTHPPLAARGKGEINGRPK